MKKLFTFILFFAIILVTGVLAAPQISLSPSEPTQIDDVLCLVDGQVEDVYLFKWYINNAEIANPNIGFPNDDYLLSYEHTKVGDIILCKVYADTPWSTPPVGEAQAVITNTGAQNLAPILSIPNIPVKEGVQFSLGLDNYVADDKTLDENILWNEYGATGISVEINAQRKIVINAPVGSAGVYTNTFTATDEDGAMSTQDVTITVSKKPGFKLPYFGPFVWMLPERVFMYPPWVNFPHTSNQPPTVNIIQPLDQDVFQVDELVVFKANALDPEVLPLTYAWNLGNTLSDLKEPKHIYTKPGTYNIAVTVKDSENQTATDQITIYVEDNSINTPPVATIIQPNNGDTFKVGELITFLGEGKDADGDWMVYSWNFISEDEAPTGQEASYTYSKVGDYQIDFWVSDGQDSDTDSIVIHIIDNPTNNAPIATIIQPNNGDTFKIGETITFLGEGKDVDNDVLVYSWNFVGMGNIAYGESTTYTYNQEGDYEIQLWVTDGQAAGMDSIVIHIVEGGIINDPDKKTLNHSGSCDWSGLDIVSIENLNHKWLYYPGDKLKLLVRVKNIGCENQDATVTFNHMNINSVNQAPNIYLYCDESRLVSYDFTIPASAKGTQLLKISALGDKETNIAVDYYVYKVA